MFIGREQEYGRLSASIPADRYFDFIVSAESLLNKPIV